MVFLLKLILALCGFRGVAIWHAATPSGSYGAYFLQLVVVGTMVVFVFLQENVPGRFYRLRYNIRKRLSSQ